MQFHFDANQKFQVADSDHGFLLCDPRYFRDGSAGLYVADDGRQAGAGRSRRARM